MNNEIGRKLTSLTLMTIMLAGGMVIAAPSMVPEAAAAGALYVSAENAMFDNHFAGPNVVEIIVKDPARSATNENAAEPTVFVDNQQLRMAQGADGYWYAYIADSTDVTTVAAVTTDALKFGATSTHIDGGLGGSAATAAIETFDSQTYTVIATGTGVIDNPPILSNWNNTNGASCTACGQLGMTATEWPVLQTFDFTQGDFDIVLKQSGNDEVVTLDHTNSDMDDYASLTLDRSSASQGSYIQMAIVDQQLNLDPTDEDVVIFLTPINGTSTGAGITWTNGTLTAELDSTSGFAVQDVTQAGVTATGGAAGGIVYVVAGDGHGFGDNGKLLINYNATGATTYVVEKNSTADDKIWFANDRMGLGEEGIQLFVFFEDGDNTGTFSNVDDSDLSSLLVAANATRGTSAIFDYNDSAQSFVVANDFGVVDMEEASVGDEWNSGEALTVTLTDQDFNTNTGALNDITISNATDLVPTLTIGSPLTLNANTTVGSAQDANNGGSGGINGDAAVGGSVSILSFSNIANVTQQWNHDGVAITAQGNLADTAIQIDTGVTVWDFSNATKNADYVFMNYDVTSIIPALTACSIYASETATSAQALVATATCGTDERSLVQLDVNVTGTGGPGTSDGYVSGATGTTSTNGNTVVVNFTGAADITANDRFYIDFFTFGDGTTTADRINNAVYRLLLEETDSNTGVYAGSAEYIMLNQLNVDEASTFSGITATGVDVVFIVHEDMTDEDSPRINYNDLGADGVTTQVADQVAAPSHSGVVSLDQANYKKADTVVVTLDDQDLNTDSGLIDIYIVRSDGKVGNGGSDHIVDITFDDNTWTDLADTGFTLVETDVDSGSFVGSFQVPEYYTGTTTATGTDIEVNYNDHRDASGETIEVGAGASVNANTGTVTFDRTVYPVPFGTVADANFKIHSTAITDAMTTASTDDLAQGDVTVHVRVSDPDYNTSATGSDQILDGAAWTGNFDSTADHRVVIQVERGSATYLISTPGNSTTAMSEVSPDSGVFEHDQAITYIQGPSSGCPTVTTSACVLQGDIITVKYTDLTDASGKKQTVTDSATFDLRNGVLQADKSVYLIGSDMILTLIEPDFDLDNDGAESYTLDLIEWDSDAATTTLGGKYDSTSTDALAFDPEPSAFRETGDSTGIFQVVIEVPATLDSNPLDRGEKIDLEYTDWGPAGADYVGQEDEDIGLTVYTSNFGATIELDQKVYTWTDKVYITIVAPDHNMDSGLIDEIGDTANDPIKVSTRGNQLANYKLVESGADTGIFIGEVTLAGFEFDADGDSSTGTSGNDISGTASSLTSTQSTSTQTGPTEGKLATTDNDGLTVSFEYSEDQTVVGSALIRWNIGEAQWLESSYPASGTGVVRIIDADMNLNPEAIDNFAVDAWSDSDAGGISLTVTETNEATGIFEGIVFFTTANDSSGSRLRVAEGDTVTAEYEDNTLPEPYTTADELNITATSLIGTIVPPLERAPAANLRTVDAFGNSLNSVSVDQQVQVAADVANGQDREQAFAYLVQIQDGDGVTVSLAWITGSLSAGQSFSPALSWIPTESGSYTATAFVWESVDNPTALSTPVSTTISVQ